MINCIHHVAVHIHDLDRRTRFYKGAFGFEAGTIFGNALKWDMKVTKPVSLTLKYDLQFDSDKISGKVKMGFFGTAKITGERILQT